MEKLRKIQQELKVEKNRYNKFGDFHYYNLSDILDALKPLLEAEKCSLVITDELIQIGDFSCVQASALFSDGETKVDVVASAGIDKSKGKMDLSQCFGSASSYARKYALNGLFLIDDACDPDSQDNNKEGSKEVKKDYPDDNRPWLKESEFNQYKDRVKGEQGLYDKIKKEYRMKKQYREELEKLSK